MIVFIQWIQLSVRLVFDNNRLWNFFENSNSFVLIKVDLCFITIGVIAVKDFNF